MTLTEEQKEEVVKEVISRAKEVLFKAELVNKGMHVHNINTYMGTIKNVLEFYDGEITYDSEGYKLLGEATVKLAGLLYYLEHKL